MGYVNTVHNLNDTDTSEFSNQNGEATMPPISGSIPNTLGQSKVSSQLNTFPSFDYSIRFSRSKSETRLHVRFVDYVIKG